MADPDRPPVEPGLAFGRFRLFPSQRLLLDGDVPVRLGRRTLGVLVLLTQRAGGLVTEEELIATVWPGVPAEQARLGDHVEVLNRLFRRARPLFEPAGGGYRVAIGPDPVPVDGPTRPRIARLIGRHATVAAVRSRLQQQRFATLVGPGGIGKTSIALAVADEAGADACFVDLSPLTDERLVPGALATALGVPTPPGDAVRALVTLIGARPLLVVVDNCEHVIDAAAALAEALLLGCRGVRVLATSREPLRAQGEWLQRVAPMELPDADPGLTAAQALEATAVQLFVDRAAGAVGRFTLTDAEAPAVAEVCRRLDGIPLAIALAAARVEHLGVAELARQIDARWSTRPPASGAPAGRHETLHAALDWSYQLLSAHEQAALRCLAVFRGEFTLEDGAAVASAPGGPLHEAFDAIVDLASKSLIAVEPRGGAVHYRLFETTRAYALDKLAMTSDARDAHLRHAQHGARRLAQGAVDWNAVDRTAWRQAYAPLMDEVRAALDWAFSPTGDVGLGVEITAGAVPFADQFGLFAEFRTRVESAADAAASLVPAVPLLELRLRTHLGDFTQQTNGAHDVVEASFTRALALADGQGPGEHHRGPLMGLCMGAFGRGDYPAALGFGQRLMAFSNASKDDLGMFVAHRMLAQSHHFLGDHAAARQHAERVLAQAGRPYPLMLSPAPIDVRCSMRVVLARILWLEGRPEDATVVADEAAEFALADRAYALCQVLSLAVIPVALWRGDDDAARTRVAQLLARARHHHLGYWAEWARGFTAILDERAGGALAGAPSGRKPDDAFPTFAGRLAGREALQRAEAGVCGWNAPEVFRVQGEQVWREGGEGAAARAATWFHRARDLAAAQQAPAWAARSAASLARLAGAGG